MHVRIRQQLNQFFSELEFNKIAKFFQRGFASYIAQNAIASLFICAKQSGIDAKVVIESLEKEWQLVWCMQPISDRADPEAKGSLGSENRTALERAYLDLGLTIPRRKTGEN